MSNPKDKSKKLTYETATGEIEFTLMSDMMFHYVMQKSERALTGLVCALKGISPDDVQHYFASQIRRSSQKQQKNSMQNTVLPISKTTTYILINSV